MSEGPRTVDAALADLALVAVSRLRIEMTTAKNSKDRIAAANSILDRLGYSRTPRVQAEVADREIQRAMEAALKGGVSEQTAHDLASMAIEYEDKLGAADESGKDQDRPKLLTRAAQVAEGQRLHDEARAQADRVAEAEWQAAAPEPDEDEGIRDFSQLGPDDEESDAWLDS